MHALFITAVGVSFDIIKLSHFLELGDTCFVFSGKRENNDSDGAKNRGADATCKHEGVVA